MTWETFYERYPYWIPSTLQRNLSTLSDYGSPEEIIEVSDYLDNASPFIHSALRAGVVFSPEQILKLDGLVDQATMEEAVELSLRQGVAFNHDQILKFDGLVSTEVLTAMVKASHLTAKELTDFDGLVDDSTFQTLEGNRQKLRPRQTKFPALGTEPGWGWGVMGGEKGLGPSISPPGYDAHIPNGRVTALVVGAHATLGDQQDRRGQNHQGASDVEDRGADAAGGEVKQTSVIRSTFA